MRMIQTIAAGAIATALMSGAAMAAGGFGGLGGTPDAQNGARGRDLPSSYYGRDPRYSGRSAYPGAYRRHYWHRGYGPGYGYYPY